MLSNQEEEILHKLHKGEEEAFEYIYLHYYSDLCRMAYQILQNSAMAEDVVADLLDDLWEKHSCLSIESSLRSYLMVSVRHRCFNLLRS